MRKFLYKLKPESGFSHFLHLLFNILLPIVVLIFVRLDLFILAAVMVLLAKWRILAVKPRYWVSNLRANLVDIKHFVLEEVEESTPGKNDVLIKVVNCGVCGTDISAYYGHHAFIKCPIILGHEFSGFVKEVGSKPC